MRIPFTAGMAGALLLAAAAAASAQLATPAPGPTPMPTSTPVPTQLRASFPANPYPLPSQAIASPLMPSVAPQPAQSPATPAPVPSGMGPVQPIRP